MPTLAWDVSFNIYHTTPKDWCNVLRRHGMQRHWDVLIPPQWLYCGTSYQVGRSPRFSVVRDRSGVVGAFVTALRGDDACLVDIRSNGPATWFDAALEDIEAWADAMRAGSIVGPVGAFAFLTDGVVTSSNVTFQSIHVPTPPPEIVDTFIRRGYVTSRTGHLNGRIGGKATTAAPRHATENGVIVGTWTTLYGMVVRMIAVLDTAFATLSWHTGPGATRHALMRTYAPVVDPSHILMAVDGDDPIGGVIVYRDVHHVPQRVLHMPIMLQRFWLFVASRRSPHVHVSVAGMLPAARRSRRGLALYRSFLALIASAQDVTTSWIDDRNTNSNGLAHHAGLCTLQTRQVFRRECLRSTHHHRGAI